MKGFFVDTNIFLRHFTGAPSDQAEHARSLLAAIEQGELSAWTTETVIAEIVWTLSGPRFRIPRAQVASFLTPLLTLTGLNVPRKQMYARVFDLYIETGIDYVDAYHAALVERRNQTALWSFDAHFDRVAGLTRLEPGRDPLR